MHLGVIGIFVCASSAFAVADTLAADNWKIPSGESATVSANAVYGELTVNGSLTIGDGVVVTANCVRCSVDASQPQSEIHLMPGARLEMLQPWVVDGSGTCHTYFKGGTLTFRQIQRLGSGTNIFEGVDNAIKLDIVGKSTPVFYYTNNVPRLLFTGNAGLVKTGGNDQLLNDWHYNKVIVMTYTGDTWINAGAINVQGCNFPATTKVHIGHLARIGLNGNTIEYASIDGDGYIFDADANRSYLKITGDSDSEMLGLDTVGTRLEKDGNGTLTVAPRNRLSFLNHKKGRVVLKSRAEAGFRSYAFKIDECRGPGTAWNATQMGEFYLFNDDGEDVTPLRGNIRSETFKDGYMECLFDRTAGTKWYSNVRWDSTPAQKEAEATIEVQFPRQVPVSSYLYGTAWDAPSRDPSAWRMLGRAGYSGNTWMTIATVTNFAATAVRDADAASTNFVISLPRRVTVPEVTLKNGTELVVDGKTELYTTNLVSAMFCNVELRNGGIFTVDPQVDQEKEFLRIAGDGTLKKEGWRTLTLLGATGVRGGIHVAGGTLKLKAGHEIAPKAFRFTFTKSRWLASNPTGDYTKNPDRHTIQFGEIALYDDKFNRINLTDSLSYCSVPNLFDGDTATSCYYTAIPEITFDVTFVFSESVTNNVTCYRFHPETHWDGLLVKTPAEWTVSVSDSKDGPWTVVDYRLSPAPSINGWKTWNNGTPFYFTNRVNVAEAAFPSSCNLQIDAGATLDLTDSNTTITELTIDCSLASSVGTLVGGTLAETGTLNLKNAPNRLNAVALPLVVSGTVLPASFKSWQILVDGVPKPKAHLAVRNGQFCIEMDGLVLVIR